MKLIDGNLYLELAEMVECGVSERYLWKAKSTGTKCWEFIKDPNDARKVLIGYEKLKDEYKRKVELRYGNPYDLSARQPILDRVINNPAAYDYFMSYQYNGSTRLPIRRVNQYTRADAWLRFLGGISLGDIKKGFGLTAPDFYSHAGELIQIEVRRGKDDKYSGVHMLPGDFPSSYQRLKNKAEAYKKMSFQDLIDPLYGNKIASKIGKYEGGFCPETEAKQMAVIRTVAAKHNNFDAAQVEGFVNVIFEQKGWETIGRSRLYQILQGLKVELTPGRRGRKAFNSEIAMQVKRSAPKFPTYYWTLDGWTVELLYQDAERSDNRLVMVVVLDPFNKYPVGYAIGERENAELIRQANRNAILHLKELFGDYYKPHQIQSDNYAVKQLTPFYQAMATMFTPAAVGNAKAKVIEPYFMYLNKQYCQKMPNWSGFNLTSRKENQVNAEMLNLIKKTFPNKDGVIRQIERIINTERAKKVTDYMAKWDEMPAEDKVVMSEMDWLMVFGVEMGAPNKITGQGIIKTIAGVSYTYDCFELEFRNNMHLNWQLRIDPNDMSKALAVSEDGKLRFVLKETMSIPMDIKSQTAEHHEYRTKVRDFNKERVDSIMAMYANDAELVSDIIKDVPLQLEDHNEAALKLMLTYGGQQKEGIQDAKGLVKVQKSEAKQKAKEQKASEQTWQEKQRAYLQSKTNLSDYL